MSEMPRVLIIEDEGKMIHTLGRILREVRHVVRLTDEHIALIAKERALFATLMKHCGEVFSHSVLLDTLWGVPGKVSMSVVELSVSSLHKALNRQGEYSHTCTVRAVGYTLTR